MQATGASSPQPSRIIIWPASLKFGGHIWAELCVSAGWRALKLQARCLERRFQGSTSVNVARRRLAMAEDGVQVEVRKGWAHEDSIFLPDDLIGPVVSSEETDDREVEDEEDDEGDSEDELEEWTYLPTILSGSVSRIGDREHNEDARITVDDLTVHPQFASLFSDSGYRQGAFYSVIDGHGGDKASTFARKHLLRYVLEEPEFRDDPKAAIRGAFLRLDDDLRKHCSLDSGKCSGAVAVVAMILDGSLVVGNVGDCRAVVSDRGKPVHLTREHRPATAKDERERVLSSGTPISKRGYVGGAIAMTRAIGDWDRPGLKHIENGENTGPVLAEPEFRFLTLTPDHEFLILGSDGVWDALTSHQVVKIARRSLVQHGDPKKCASQIAAKAIRASRKNSRADNVTVVAVCFPSQ